MFGFHEIICETGLKPNSDTYTQLQHHQRRTLWSNMKSDYVSLWYTQFRKLRASKGSDLLLCNDTEFDLGSIQTGRDSVKLTASLLHKKFEAARPVWMLRLINMCSKTSAPCFTPSTWCWRVTSRSQQLKAALQGFPHYKVPLTFRYSCKRLRKRRSKNLIKFPQVDIAFVLQYVHCFEKNNTYWLNESWETRLPKRLKCTISIFINIFSLDMINISRHLFICDKKYKKHLIKIRKICIWPRTVYKPQQANLIQTKH